MTNKKLTDLIKQERNKIIANKADKEFKKLLTNLCPIYRADTNNNPEQYGTGVFIVLDTSHFLLTAAHVLDESKKSTLYIPGTKNKQLVELKGKLIKTIAPGGNRNLDRIDFGALLLDPDFVEKMKSENFIPLSQIDIDDTGTPSSVYIAIGYPWRMNQKLDHQKLKITRNPFSYTSKNLSHEMLNKIGLNNGSHLLIGFNKRHSKDQSGRDITAPHPHGMSGGGLWKIKNSAKGQSTSNLVGVLIEWREEVKGLLAVRIPIILAAIANEYPELGNFIPKTSTVKVTVN